MKYIFLTLVMLSIISSALAFRGGGGGFGGGGGGFRGGGMHVGAGVSSGGTGSRGNVNVGVGVNGPRGSVTASRSAAMSAHYHGPYYGYYGAPYYPYYPTYWGWYGYAPYHYYYYVPSSTPATSVSPIPYDENKALDVGTMLNALPENCKTEKIDGTSYKHCGVNWFVPQFSGTEVEYEAVKSPL